MSMMKKTNAMRLLSLANIAYSVKEYEVIENGSFGKQAAEKLGVSEDEIFKTLVTVGDKNGINIFCIPVNCELNLKKAAHASQNKKVEMVLMKDVLATTGYMVGACSPIGMKKQYPTYIDETAILFDEIGVSAGVRGGEIILNPYSLCSFVNAAFCDLT